MKKISIFVLALLMIISFYSCNNDKFNNDSKIDAILPDSSIIVFKLKNLNFLYEDIIPNLNIKDENIKKIVDFLGFDPLNPKELNDFGIDKNGEFGVVFNDFRITDLTYGEQPVLNCSFFLPINEGKDVLGKIVNIINNISKGEGIKLEKNENMYVYKGHGNNPDISLYEYKDFVFATIAFKSDPKLLFSSLGKKVLKDNEIYKKLLSENKTGGFSVYFNGKDSKFLKDLSEMMRKRRGDNVAGTFDFYKGYDGGYISFDASSPDLLINGVGLLDKDSPMTKIYQGVEYDRNPVLSIVDSPFLYISFGINAGEYMDYIKKAFTSKQIEKFEKSMAELSKKIELDLPTFINNLGGNFNYATYDGSSLNIMKYNTVFSLTFKDENSGKTAMEKLLSLLKDKNAVNIIVKYEDIQGIKTAVVTSNIKFYLGVKNKSLIFSTEKSYYEQALSGNVKKGFTARMENVTAEQFLNSDIFYFSLNEGMKLFEKFKPLLMMGMNKKVKDMNTGNKLDKITKTVNKFKYILMSSRRFDNGLLKMQIRIKTSFEKSFIKGIVNIIKEYTEKKIAEQYNQNPNKPKF